VAVDEGGRDKEARGVDYAIGRDVGGGVGFADEADALAVDDDRGIAQDAALVIEREHKSGVIDLEGGLRHGTTFRLLLE
jgi:hypothetical protein